MTDTDISPEAVADMAFMLRQMVAGEHETRLHGAADMLETQAAAIRAAEAAKRQAVLDERERCAAKVERDQWPTFGDSRRIAAAIRNQGEPK